MHDTFCQSVFCLSRLSASLSLSACLSIFIYLYLLYFLSMLSVCLCIYVSVSISIYRPIFSIIHLFSATVCLFLPISPSPSRRTQIIHSGTSKYLELSEICRIHNEHQFVIYFQTSSVSSRISRRSRAILWLLVLLLRK